MPQGIETTAPEPTVSKPDFKGLYSLRFAGFGVAPLGYQFHVAGVGQIKLDGNGNLSGEQYSSLAPIGAGATGYPFDNETFDLSGTYAIGNDGTGTVSVDFSQAGVVVESDVFRVVPGDATMTRFWLISTAPTMKSSGKIVPELVSGEVVKLS